MKRRRKLRNESPASSVSGQAPLVKGSHPALDARRVTAWHLLLLTVVTLGLYAAALRNDFVTDDALQMLSNPFITSYRYIPRLFASDVWAFSGAASTTNFYRPLQMLVYMAQYYAFGFQPWPFHFVNLLTGLADVIAVYFLVRALARQVDGRQSPVTASASFALAAALVFAAHPVHVEPIAWIASLPDLLCGLLLFTATLFYHRARTGSRPLLNHAVATAAYLPALFFKEIAMVFPAILLAYEFLYRRESLRKTLSFPVLRNLTSYVAALAIYIFIRVQALGGFAPASAHRVTLKQNILSVPELFAQYVAKLFLPLRLDYYYYFVPENAVSLKFIASVLLIAALVAAMFWLRPSEPLLSFGIAWFFITLAPALSIDNVSGMIFTERYMFVPSLGFCIFAAWAWFKLVQPGARKSLVRDAAYAAAVLLFGFYVLQVERRIPYWHDDLRLLEDAARQSPDAPDVQLELGVAYYRAGECDLAIAPLERSIDLGRSDYQPHLFLALCLPHLGREAEAAAELFRAYQFNRLGLPAWPVFGLAHAGLGQWEQAADCYRRGAEQNPNNQLMFELEGEALQEKGDLPGAMAAWQHAIELQPGYLDASINLAVAVAQSGNTDEAVSLLNAAIQAHPQDPHTGDAYVNLGTVYVHRGQLDAAESAYQSALGINPDLNFARQSIDQIEVRRHSQP